MKKQNYKPARIYDADGDLGKQWFVYFHILNPLTGKYERHKEYVSISLNKVDRLYELQLMAQRVNHLLESGKIKYLEKVANPKKESLKSTIQKALDYKSTHLSARGVMSYQSSAGHLLKWLKRKRLLDFPTTNFTKNMAVAAYREISLEKKWAPKTANNNLSYWRALLQDAVEREVIQKNPFVGISTLKEPETEIILWNPDQKKAFADYCKREDPQLFIVMLLVYHCFIRPQEIVRLRFSDLDFYRGIIRIDGQNSKNKKSQPVTMSRQLARLLQELSEHYPEDYFIISTGLQPGKKQIKTTRISERFNKAKKVIGLPKALKLYSLKHTGNSEMLAEGVSLELLKEQNRHHSVSQTEVYAKRI